jgi:hypothetical protein
MCIKKQCRGLFEARGIVGTYAGRKYEIREVNSLTGKNESRGARKNDGGHFFRTRVIRYCLNYPSLSAFLVSSPVAFKFLNVLVLNIAEKLLAGR